MKISNVHIQTDIGYWNMFHLPSLVIGIFIGLALMLLIAGLMQL